MRHFFCALFLHVGVGLFFYGLGKSGGSEAQANNYQQYSKNTAYGTTAKNKERCVHLDKSHLIYVLDLGLVLYDT